MNNVSIQGNPLYINYEFDFFTFHVLVACLPMAYLVPTVFIILKIFKVYCRQLAGKREETMNPYVFLVIVTSQLTVTFLVGNGRDLFFFQSICYMISDYITIRLPFTGILTSWCASQEPNHFLKILFFFSIYFSYTSWLFPFLLSTLRLIPVYYPRKHNQVRMIQLKSTSEQFSVLFPNCQILNSVDIRLSISIHFYSYSCSWILSTIARTLSVRSNLYMVQW